MVDGVEGKTSLRLDSLQASTLDKAKFRVLKKNWDYVALVVGLPSSGKSTLAISCAKYCCPWFDETYIAFNADEFIELTKNCRENSSVMLDESFASLNSRTTMTEDFIKIVNHLQLIRQKLLFIFLCLPNFFDLAKGIAIFRSSHLFVTYADEEGDRGRFLAFDRDAKRKLYVKGSKYMDYNCVKSNYYAVFFKNEGIVNDKAYLNAKYQHLQSQNRQTNSRKFLKISRDEIIYRLKTKFRWKTSKIMRLTKISRSEVNLIIKKQRIMADNEATGAKIT